MITIEVRTRRWNTHVVTVTGHCWWSLLETAGRWDTFTYKWRVK